MKNINELINSIELEELSEREEFVNADVAAADIATAETNSEGITLARWILEF